MKLRDYQVVACRDIARAWETARRVLFTMPTGTGKTEVGAAVVYAVRQTGARVLWLAQRRELVQQAVTRLVENGLPIGTVGVLLSGDDRVCSTAPIQVGSVDTVRRQDIRRFDVVVVDEAHHAPAATWMALLDAQSSARVLGLSATPYRLGRKQLGECFDVLVQGPLPSVLIEAGWMARPRLFAPEDHLIPDLAEVRTGEGGDYKVEDLAKAANRREIVGGIVEHRQRIAPGLRAVAFAVDIAHAESIALAFREAGERWAVVTGDTPKRERDARLTALADGAIDGVANCAVLTEGWDCPAAKCAILARPTRSLALYVQTAGRILRPWEGVTPIILDHAGNACWFDVPHKDRELSLRMTPPRRERYAGRAMERTETGELVSIDGELVEFAGPRVSSHEKAIVACVSMVEALGVDASRIWSKEELLELTGEANDSVLGAALARVGWRRLVRRKAYRPPGHAFNPKWKVDAARAVELRRQGLKMREISKAIGRPIGTVGNMCVQGGVARKNRPRSKQVAA